MSCNLPKVTYVWKVNLGCQKKCLMNERRVAHTSVCGGPDAWSFLLSVTDLGMSIPSWSLQNFP